MDSSISRAKLEEKWPKWQCRSADGTIEILLLCTCLFRGSACWLTPLLRLMIKTKINFLFSLGSNRNHWLCTNHDSHRWIAPICGCNSDPHLRSWGKLHSHDWIERVLDKVSLWLGQWSKSRSCFKANHGICKLKIWGREWLWESFCKFNSGTECGKNTNVNLPYYQYFFWPSELSLLVVKFW